MGSESAGIHHRKFMQKALQAARKGIRKSEGGPFGACLVKGRRVLAVTQNTVLKRKDATCHAEINAIRKASKKIKNWSLQGCVLYSTTEPCPMCFSAIHWARIDRVVYGTSIRDAKNRGFRELSIGNRSIKRLGKSPVRIRAGFMQKECKELLKDWEKMPNQKRY